MKKQVLWRFLGGALVAIASNAHAQTADVSRLFDGFEWKPYLQASLGAAQISSPSATGTAMNLNGTTTSTSTSVRATVGLQLNPYWGLEGTWFQLPSTGVKTNVGDAAYKGDAYVASVTGSLPLPMNISLVGRVGVGTSDITVSVPTTTYNSNSRENLVVWGAGARFNFNKSLDVTVDYDNLGTVAKYARGDNVTVEMLSIGMRFKF